MRRSYLAISVGSAVLLGAAVLQMVPPPNPRPGKGRHLVGALPLQLPGWESRELALGASEASSGQVEDVLKFDDYYFHEFLRGREKISVYVAYWSPGKMPVQVVASHTPDQCWVQTGWICDQVIHDGQIGESPSSLRQGQGRIFHDGAGNVQYVMYWHLVGDDLFDYGTRVSTIPSPWKWVREMGKQPFTAPKEQYFIRVSSDHPFQEVQSDPGVQELIAALGRLGLASR